MSHTLDSAAHALSAPSRSPWGWLALGVLGTSTVVLAALNVVQWRTQQDAAAPVAASLSAPAPALGASATGAVAPVAAPTAAPAAPTPTAASTPVAPRPVTTTAQRSSASSAQKPASARVSTHDTATKRVASAEPMTEPADDPAAWQRERERSAPTSPAPTPTAAPAHAVCHQCGTVEAITPVTQEGPASGIGAVAGGLLGGLLGNQVGGGEGKTLATMAGVVGGAWAGNTVEKRMKPQTSYQVRVRMDDGSLRSIEQSSPSVGVGSRVQVQGSVLSPVVRD